MTEQIIVAPHLAISKVLLFSVLMLIAGGPAMSTDTDAPQDSSEIRGDIDVVRADVIDVLSSRGIPVDALDEDGRSFVSESVSVSDPSLAVCEQLSWGERVLEYSAVYTVLVRGPVSGPQRVTVNGEYQQERWSMTKDDVHDVRCESTGAFEAALLDELERRALSR